MRTRVRAANPADVPAIARVHVDAWRETYPGLFPAFVLDALTYEEREAQWREALSAGGSCLFVAEVEGNIAGFAAGGPNREPAYPDYPGELWAIYLLRAYQGLGLGGKLFENVRAWLHARELDPFYLWAVADNPACAFYERMGGTRVIVQAANIRGAQIIECAYGFGAVTSADGQPQPEAGMSSKVDGSTS